MSAAIRRTRYAFSTRCETDELCPCNREVGGDVLKGRLKTLPSAGRPKRPALALTDVFNRIAPMSLDALKDRLPGFART